MDDEESKMLAEIYDDGNDEKGDESDDTPFTTVLSVDVGIRNLGIALFQVPSDPRETRVLDLTTISLLEASEKAKQVTAQQVTERAERRFEEYLRGRRVDAVLIENQPYRSGVGGGVTMKLLAHGMIQYFRHRRDWGHEPTAYGTVELVHARNKLNVEYETLGVARMAEDLPTGTYAQRKKSGVVLARHLLGEMGGRIEDGLLDAFKRCKKKDDCADAFLQGLWWIVRRKQ